MDRITPFFFALKNIRARPFRSLITFCNVMIASGLLFSGTVAVRGIEKSVDRGIERLGADIMVVPQAHAPQARSVLLGSEPSVFYMEKNVIDDILSVKGVSKASPQVFVVSAPAGCCDIPGTRIIGFDPKTDFTLSPWVPDILMNRLRENGVITGEGLPFRKGQEIKLYGTGYSVSAVLDRTGIPFIDRSIFIPLDSIRQMIADSKVKKGVQPISISPDSISAVLVKIGPSASAYETAIYLEAKINGIKAVLTEDVILSVKRNLFRVTGALYAVIAVLWLLVLLNTGATYATRAGERKREAGLLMAMGAGRGYIFRQFLSEALIETSAGGISGLFLGGIMTVMIESFVFRGLGISFQMPELDFLVPLAAFCVFLSLLSGVLASLPPAMKIIRTDPYDAIRGGEL